MGRRGRPWPRKADGQWYATIRGKQVKLGVKVKGKGGRAEAEKAFHALMAAEPAPEGGDGGAVVTLRELAHKYLDAARGRVRAISARQYERRIRQFVEGRRERPAEGIAADEVRAWAKSRGWGCSTSCNAFAILKAMYAWGLDAGLIGANPLAKLKRPPMGVRKGVMTAALFERVLAAYPDRAWKDFLTFMRETGCRPGEAIGLEARHLDWAAGTATMEGKTTGATGRMRVIYLTPRAVELCRELAGARPEGPIFRNARGTPWTFNTLAVRFHKARKPRKVDGVAVEGLPKGTCAELLRHGFATDALKAGVPIATVSELMGHADTGMVARVYSKLHREGEHLREELAKARPQAE